MKAYSPRPLNKKKRSSLGKAAMNCNTYAVKLTAKQIINELRLAKFQVDYPKITGEKLILIENKCEPKINI